MTSNLPLYRRVIELKDALELADEQSRPISLANLTKAVKLIDEIFILVDRRTKSQT